jgi:hypothetical protein
VRRAPLVRAALVLFAAPVFSQDTVPEPTRRTDAPYRMFRTQNTYTLLKLDTRTGQGWQVQWGKDDERFIVPIT